MLVQALVAGEPSLLETVMATPAELAAAGVPKDVVDKVAAAALKRGEQVAALQKQLVGWNAQTIWNRFDGTFPHVIPADPASGLEKDVTLYENAMVIPGRLAAQQNAAKMAFLQVPDMIQLGATWKFIELPRAIDPEKPIVAADERHPRDALRPGQQRRAAGRGDGRRPQGPRRLRRQECSALSRAATRRRSRSYHVGRIPLSSRDREGVEEPEEKLGYNKQVVDSLVAALRTGLYPEGRKPLDAIVEEGGKLGFLRRLQPDRRRFRDQERRARRQLRGQSEEVDGRPRGVPREVPRVGRGPAVLFQLANANEFNAEEAKAREQYGKLVKDYAATDAGKKAAGALRRLDLVGKPLAIKGTGLQNETVDSAQYRGKPVLIVFWASWATPVKQDLPELIKLYEKYQERRASRSSASISTTSAPSSMPSSRRITIAWPQIFEPGGMESRLAVDYGIISLPSMFLVDSEGKVVNRNLRTSAEVDRQLEKMLAQKPAGVALDRRD